MRRDRPPDIFGLPGLDPKEKEAVRFGTLLAHRKAEALAVAHSKGLPFWAETPARRPGKPSVFKLPKFPAVLELSESRR